MADQSTTQRLAAVLAADVAGYTRLMEKDSEGTVAAWQSARAEVIRPTIESYSGHIVKLTGDGFLVEFPTVQKAVRCAIEMQRELVSSSLDFRMGINLGDIIDDGEDIHGEGVNVAARLEALADPGGINISGDVYNQIRNRVEATFEDLGEHEVKNVTYPVRVFAIRSATAGSATVETPATDKPSIAVLPFDNLSGDPEQEYFADGMTEDIITALSRFQSFLVIARNTAFTYKGKAVDVQQAAADLAVRYVLEGSVRKSGERVRVTAQLIDGKTGHHIWAERYDKELIDIFDLQDEVTRSIVAAIPGRVAKADFERIRRKRPENISAYECMLRGRVHHHRATKEDNEEAIRFLDHAIELDPEFAQAYAWLSCTYGQALLMGFGDNKDELFAKDIAAAEKALELDENNFDTQWIMCELHLMRDRVDEAEIHHEKAFSLNPNDPRIVAQRGELMTWLGRPEEGADWVRQSMRLDPFEANSRAHLLGRALLMAQQYEDAIGAYGQIRNPRFGHHAEIAVCHALRESQEHAKRHADEALRLNPNLNITDFMKGKPFRNPEHREYYKDGLRKAGFPEG